MTQGDPVFWTNPDGGHTQVGIYVATYGRRLVIETTSTTGHLALRYVDPKDVRGAQPQSEKSP